VDGELYMTIEIWVTVALCFKKCVKRWCVKNLSLWQKWPSDRDHLVNTYSIMNVY
jgi:hypothetical protein